MNHKLRLTPVWVFAFRRSALLFALLAFAPALFAAAPPSEPVVARVEMKLTDGEEVVDVIEQGDLLTVIEERDEEYVIVTHDGHRGVVEKVNAVKIAESGDIYTDLIQRNPLEGRYYTLRASSWWALGKVEAALDDFDQAIELGYEEPHAFISRGLFHASSGDYEKAIADYEKALEADPQDIAPLVNRAAVYMMMGDYEKAIEDYTAALDQEPQRTSLLHQRAIAHKATGDLDQAAADFTSILEANEKDVTAVMGRGYVYFQQQNHSAAIEDFARALQLRPQDPVAYNNRGYNRFKVGDFAGALEDYDHALKIAPKYALALQNRAWLLATAEDSSLVDPDAAVESAKLACELTNYESVGDLSALAAALAASGKFDQAVGWQEKVVEMTGEHYKEFAAKILKRYQQERPFAADPDAANAKEQAEAEKEAAEKASTAKEEPAEDTAESKA